MSAEDIEASKAPLMDHLIELRSRLIKALLGFGIAFIVCFFFAKQIYNVLVWPFIWVAGPENSKLIYTALLEYFFTQLKLALFGAGFISFPIVATQIYKFVAPGLYKNERSAFLPYLIATPVFFLLGAMLVYFVVMPMLMRFSLGMQQMPARNRADRAAAEGQRISVADHDADLRLRHRLPVAGDPDAARADRRHHLETASRQAPLIHRRRLHRRRRADAARRAEPGVLALPLLLLYEVSIIAVAIVEKNRRQEGRAATSVRWHATAGGKPGGVGRAGVKLLVLPRFPCRHRPRKRTIQYSEAPDGFQSRLFGLLDARFRGHDTFVDLAASSLQD